MVSEAMYTTKIDKETADSMADVMNVTLHSSANPTLISFQDGDGNWLVYGMQSDSSGVTFVVDNTIAGVDITTHGTDALVLAASGL